MKTKKEELDRKEFEKQFINLAGNIHSSIDKNVLKNLAKNLDQNYSEQEVERLIEEIDEDGNGKIEFEEFLNTLANKSVGDENIVKQAFAILDRTDSGYITLNDLRHAMLCLGENYTNEEINEMISLVDDDQDGVIKYLNLFLYLNLISNYWIND